MSYPVRRSVWATAILCAVGAAPAVQAQSSVTVFGLVDASIGRFQLPGGASITAVESGKMTTNNWGMRGTEDLGGGLKASFSLDGFFRADVGAQGRFNGDPMFTRSAWVGLSGGGGGAVNLGRNTTAPNATMASARRAVVAGIATRVLTTFFIHQHAHGLGRSSPDCTQQYKHHAKHVVHKRSAIRVSLRTS